MIRVVCETHKVVMREDPSIQTPTGRTISVGIIMEVCKPTCPAVVAAAAEAAEEQAEGRRHGDDMAAPEGPADGHPSMGAGLCSLPHYCPNCQAHDGPCMDLFTHPACGTVACATGG